MSGKPTYEELEQRIEELEGALASHAGLTGSTQIRRTEEELMGCEETIRGVGATAMDGFFLLDPAGKIREVNQTYCQMSGYSEQELLSMSVWDLDANEDESEVLRRAREITETEEGRFEAVHRRKDGTCFDVVASVQYCAADGGCFVAFIRDISHRKEAAAQRIAQRERLEAVSKIGAMASSKLMLEANLDVVLASTVELLRASAGMIFLYDTSCGRLVWRGALGLSEDFLRSFEQEGIRPGEGLTGRIFQSGSPIFIREDSSQDPRIAREVVRREGLNSFIGVPLQGEDKIIGVMNILTRPPRVLEEQDLDVCLTVASQVSMSIRNAMLYEELLGAERSLKESEQRYRMVLDTINEGVILQAASGEILTWNKGAQEVFGLSAAEVLGETSEERDWPTIHEDGSKYLGKDHPSLRTLRSGQPCRNEIMGVCQPSGDVRWISINTHPLYQEPGEAPHAVTISFSEITAEKEKELRLRESEGKFRALVEQSGEMLFLHDLEGKLIDVNQAAIRGTGYSREELAKMSVFDIDPDASDREDRKKVWEAIAVGVDPIVFEARHRRKDGTGYPVEIILSKVKLSQGEYVLALARDVSERKEVERVRSNQAAQFAAIFNSAPNVLALVNDQLRIEQCNQVGLDFVHKAIEEIRGRLGGEAFNCLHAFEGQGCGKNPICQRCPIRTRVESTFKTGVSYHQEEFSHEFLIHGKRRELDLLITTTLVTIDDERMVLLSLSDISKLKRAEREQQRLQEQLNQAQKLESIGRLAGGVAHDFNNMLSVILFNVHLLREEVEPEDDSYSRLVEIDSAAQRSVEVTRQLLAFARKQTIAPRVIDLNGTVEGMLQMLRRLIGEDIDIVWRPGDRLPPVLMDPSQVDQILANICINARDAIAGVGTIRIETSTVAADEADVLQRRGHAPDDYVQLTVVDNGSGMDEETLEHLFEPFFTTKDVNEGTGLGLATVYGIVRQNSGFIEVQSKQGEGTRLVVYLPRHWVVHQQVEVKHTAEEMIPGSETVLVVEDEPLILKMIKSILERLGYTVLDCLTPAQAIHLAREHEAEIHLLITDVIMPGMNGRQLADTLLEIYPNLKRLFISGYTKEVIGHHGVLDEGTHFLQKPFSKEKLSLKVRAVLEEAK